MTDRADTEHLALESLLDASPDVIVDGDGLCLVSCH